MHDLVLKIVETFEPAFTFDCVSLSVPILKGVVGAQFMSKAVSCLLPAGRRVLKSAIRVIIACTFVAATAQAHAQSSSPASVKAAEQAAADAADRLDFAAMERFAKFACDGGSQEGCLLLLKRYDGGIHYRPNDPQPYRAGEPQPMLAANTLQILCDRGKAGQCEELARRLERGVPGKLPKDGVRAAPLYQRACDLGNARGCSRGGDLYADGTNVPADPVTATRLLEKACQVGNTSNCEYLAQRYAAGRGVAKDDAAAARLYRKICDSLPTGSGELAARGCSEIGQAYLAGRGAAKDITLGLTELNKACRGMGDYPVGVGPACNVLGDAYGNNTVPGVARDVKRAYTYFARACELKDERGCYNFGVANAGGIGTQRDLKRAVIAYNESCSGSNGVVDGCLKLAEIAVSGEMQLNLMAARSALISAGRLKPTAQQMTAIKTQSVAVNDRLCEQGDGVSCVIVGQSYAVGDGVAQDRAKAALSYQKACDMDVAEGCASLGSQLLQEGSSSADHVRAAALLRRACDGRSPVGCYFLGAVYANGMGVEADKQMAIRLMKQAKDLYPSSELEKRILDALQTLEK